MRRNLFGDPVSQRGEILGCGGCPLNRQPNTNKVMGLDRVRGRKTMIWAMCPGKEENDRGLELVGRAGRLLWETMALYGLERRACDIQNVVRCMPWDKEKDAFRDPKPKELRCCSVYNDEAFRRNHGAARVHLILGEVAGAQLLGADYSKDRPIFWHEPWDAYVVLNYHPSYIARIGGKSAGGEYLTFRDRFRAVTAVLKHPGRWGYLKAQDYKIVRTLAEFDEMERVLRSNYLRRISLDVENSGDRLLMVGFGAGSYKDPRDWESWTGRSFSVVLDHPQAGYEPTHLKALQERVRGLVEDPSLRKSLQNGSYDGDMLKRALGATLAGYDYDTQYGTYLKYSWLRSCSLENLTYRFFPEFCDYKDVVAEWGDFADAPIDRLALRNSGDCDVTQRLEQRFAGQVSHALVEVYIHAAKTLALMNDRGPLLDKPNWEAADRALKPIIEKLDRDLNVAVGHEFDCDSPKQVAQLLYDKLGMTPPDGSRTTVKPVLEYLQATTGDELHGRILDKINRRRAVGKLKSTYVAAFKRSADRHDGELRTIWWLTGAVTGRLRSGGGDRADILNFQNFANNALIQNMICSDLEWKKALSQSNIDKLLDYEVFLAGDGAQIELRALAELASDKPLIKIFRDHAKDRKNPALDPHCVEGHLLTGLPVEKIKQDQKVRRMVKGTVFGIVYGLGEGNVYPYVIAKLRSIEGPAADLSDITPERCIDTHRKFFEVHGGVRSFHEAMRGMAEKKGYVESLFGFRRDIRQEDETRETYWGNQAVNSPVQSTAHMFILICLALLDRKPKTYSRLQNCIAEIHDALYFRVKLRHLPEAYRQFMQLFEHDATAYAERRFHLKLRVPILAEAKAGFTMASMIDYEGGPLAEFLPAWRDKEKKIEARSWEDLL